MNTFQGCDFTNSPANVDATKSPNCVNMVRDVPGKIRKSMGWHTINKYPDKINGSFYLRSSDEQLIHSGTCIYYDNIKLYENANNERSKAWQFEDKLYIQDGKEWLVYTSGSSTDKPSGYTTVSFKGKDLSIKLTLAKDESVTFRFPISIESFWLEYDEIATRTDYGDGEKVRYLFTNTDEETEYTFHFKLYCDSDYEGEYTYIKEDEGIIDGTSGDYVDSLGRKRKVQRVAEVATIPTVTIAKQPNGGGTSYYALNLLQPGFIELFQGTDSDTAYHLSFSGLDSTTVKAWWLDSNGDWVEKTEGTHFSVNRATGVVTFTTAPGKSPLTGEDNVKIQAYRTVEGYADRVNHTNISILFGVNGNGDRIFCSGNPDYINYDWYSDKDDPSYFPDTAYATLGSSSSAIMGYTIISNYLAAHKDDKERDTNIILREGNLIENEPSFPIVASLQGAGAVAPWSFAYLETEPIFLTKRGIYAVTAQDITGEKYSQNRSYFIDGKLLKEDRLKDAYACVFNDFYLLSINGKLYILDGLQPIRTDNSMPYSTRMYACFYRENVPATCIWTFNDRLYFGTEDGKLCTFYTDSKALESYNDDGEAIPCVWETPDLDGKYFFKNKTFKYFAVRLDSAIATSVNIFTMKRGIWNHAKTDSTKARYFYFPSLDFSKFTFGTDTTQKIIHTKIRVKKVDKARFRLTNTEVDEPFGIFDVALEYIENGNYKG